MIWERPVGVWQPWYTTGVWRIVVGVRSERALSEEDLVTIQTAVGSWRTRLGLRSGPLRTTIPPMVGEERKKALAAIQDELASWCEGKGIQHMTVTEIISVEGP